MDYYKAEFTIDCPAETLQAARELLAQTAGDAGFEAFEDTRAGIDGYIQAGAFRKEKLDEAIRTFPLQAVITYELSGVVAQDWNKEWEQQGFAPIDIDGKLVVFDATRPVPNIKRDVEIAIEAKLAFGTGTHETTQMALAQLLRLPVIGKRILDCGCGTGILGIAASKLGAAEVVCYDIDSWSVKNTQHNARINGVNNLHVMEGDASVLSHTSGLFDIVLANINRNTLIDDLPQYKDVLSPCGTLILSGFYTKDIPLLKQRAGELGLRETARREINDWCMLALQ
ncbi:MAG: 50S ribosomal protein L11 methyltransferase [Prevotella sp.]|nr:50S ribosomal protein L11 methyltransferase [Prevotella sp.]